MPLNRSNDPREEGIAMITAILVSAVILTLSVTATTLAIHNTGQSGLDRQRMQVVADAEAGVNMAFSTLQSTPTANLPCTIQGQSTVAPPQQYTATIQYFDASGTALTCNNPGLLAQPSSALITSTSTPLPASVSPSAKRTMQSQVSLSPVYGGFDTAIMSDGSPTTSNNLTVNGDNGDDGDVYTNGSWSCSNSMTIHGQMVAQGNISMINSCQITKDVWANGSVTMSNNTVAGHDVTSSTSSITLNNAAHILNNATAGTTISGSNIDGTKTQNHPQAAPPAKTFPVITWNQSAWQNAGWTVKTISSCSYFTPTNVQSDLATGKTVYRVTPACALTWSNNTSFSLANDMAIVTDGSIGSANKTTFTGSGSTRNLYWIVPYGTACPAGNVSTSNNTSFSNVKVFVYTPCTASFSNNNAGTGGQIFAGNVTISNLFTLNYSPLLIPGAGDITGYKVNIAYVREITNP
jgi:hypothetical protein